MSYAEAYFGTIRQGLADLVATDAKGSALAPDEALEMWADTAYGIRNERKGLLFFCGNGASASMAEHMSHDWFQNAAVNTLTCAETAHLTAIANDIGYDQVFGYRVRRVLSHRDMLVGISASGNSPNIVNAVLAAREKEAFVVTLSGMGEGNRIRGMGDLNFYVPLAAYGEVESAHAVLLHCALDRFLDKYMGGRH